VLGGAASAIEHAPHRLQIVPSGAPRLWVVQITASWAATTSRCLRPSRTADSVRYATPPLPTTSTRVWLIREFVSSSDGPSDLRPVFCSDDCQTPWSVGGAAPAPGTPPKPTPTAEPLPNVTVRVRHADGTDLEQVTDEQGQTTFDLAAGEYLVYLPVDAQTQPALQYASSVRAMPDGTLVRDWATAEVDAAQTSRFALQIVLQLP
jgi:hypothetical protein